MQAWAVLLSLVVLLAVLAHGRVKPALAFTTLAAALVLTGVIDSEAMLTNYANPTLITLVLLLLVSVALERSHFLDVVSERLLTGSERFAVLKLMGASALMSAFLNNTAVVAAFLGAISRQRRFAPSRLLIPLSYASILGGVTTLVGTSTNLVVSSFAVNAGLPPLAMFQFAWVGVPVALISLLVLWWSSRWLPHNDAEDRDARLAYFLAAEVDPTSPMNGRTIEENQLRNLEGLYLLEIEREGRLITPVGPGEVIEPRDVLIFTGEVEKVQALQRFPGLTLFGNRADDILATNLVEVVIANESELANKTLQEVDFRAMFNAGVVGIRRGEKRLTGQLGRIPLRVGDCLLLATGSDFTQLRNIDRNFHLLSGGFKQAKLTPRESTVTLAGFLGVIAMAAGGVMPLFHGLLVLLGALLAFRILRPGELRRRFPFELFMIIGSALTVAEAMETSGGARLVVEFMQWSFHEHGVYAAFIGTYLLTLVLTETVTNNAAAALAFPLAWSTAQAFGVDPMPFIMAVAFGASACFLIPYGYQTHLMVYSPGRYRMTDYIKSGIPLTLTYSTIVIALTPLIFPFQ
ncbi:MULTISPECIES: SLC13 family permease [unclassified Guyparkeria]|uniref:SLC13 family permease n=1 Tax=unclassified Guyparkeria TaxID=2626246 RepID=UPI00073360A2|nr:MULTISPECIES: SLC13 family permease [unclassified Guyparkeria]KTG16286.1 carboxylate transporter [Guyparkeria sp. XI15]OAE85137.1 carboxylate transporter [Guyparkeria sp. WRN-7]